MLLPAAALGQAQPPGANAPLSPGAQLFQKGMQALENQDRETALQLFSDAWKFEKELDLATRGGLNACLSKICVEVKHVSRSGLER